MAEPHLIIIDGYNLIHRTDALRPGKDRTLREARDKLLSMLGWVFGPGGGARFLVVFDGAEERGGEEGSDRIEVRYSRPPEKADDLIRRLVEEKVERVERLTVVTADLEVARHARAMGADVSLSDLFIASVLGPRDGETPEKPTTMSKKDLEEWVEIFRERRSGQGNPAPED